MTEHRAVIVGAALALSSCSGKTKELPPVGEILVVVDTDMPVPTFVGRLRVDVYAPDGTWYESRDLGRAEMRDWPTSFGVYLADPAKEQVALVRLRAYPEGEVRDYRGERYAPRPTSMDRWNEEVPAPEPTGQPRLVRDDGSDVTPATEPAPLLTIDRLFRVRVLPNTRAAVHVVLHGACVGTMADLANATSCIDTENTRVPVADEATTEDTSLPATSLVGTFDRTARCTALPRLPGTAKDGTPLYDDEACVDGKMFIFGSSLGFGAGEMDDVPKRVAILQPFRIDRYEVTVARWRDALARGFKPPLLPIVNNDMLPTESSAPDDTRVCTWSDEPIGREMFPLNCIDWASARAFCQFLGGDLATETQWEYVAADVARPSQTPFPWGGIASEAVACDRAVVGRGPFPLDNACNLDAHHFGPLAVDARSGPGGDVSLGLGIVNLAGNVSEWVRDAFAPFTSTCWASQPLASPACDQESAVARVARGGSWYLSPLVVYNGIRRSFDTLGGNAELGFRCVRPGT